MPNSIPNRTEILLEIIAEELYLARIDRYTRNPDDKKVKPLRKELTDRIEMMRDHLNMT